MTNKASDSRIYKHTIKCDGNIAHGCLIVVSPKWVEG